VDLGLDKVLDLGLGFLAYILNVGVDTTGEIGGEVEAELDDVSAGVKVAFGELVDDLVVTEELFFHLMTMMALNLAVTLRLRPKSSERALFLSLDFDLNVFECDGGVDVHPD